MATGMQGHRGGSPARPSRWLLVAALVVALGAGVVLGRVTAAGEPRTIAEDAERSREAAWTGPSRVEAGVPVGYPRSHDGAVAAAAQYGTALDGRATLVEEERDAVLAVIAAEGAHEQIGSAMQPGIEIAVETFGLTREVVDSPGFVGRSVPAGYQVESYDEDDATVLVWSTSVVFAEGRLANSNQWTTQRLTLRWESEDWKLIAFTTTEGPTPPDTPTPPRPAVGESINAFERFSYVPLPE